MDAITTGPILSRPPIIYQPLRSGATDTIAFFQELDALLTLENYNGFTLQPTPYAYGNAHRYLEGVSYRMRLPRPEFTPDGEGGIDIEWEHQGRRLALSCRAQRGERDFISWREAGGRYDGNEASEDLLDDRLRWLTR